jgi:hypothetical protein
MMIALVVALVHQIALFSVLVKVIVNMLLMKINALIVAAAQMSAR